jgi:hypothetical protein
MASMARRFRFVLVLALVSGAPRAGAQDEEAYDEECPSPAAFQSKDAATLTNKLVKEGELEEPIVLEHGDRPLTFQTDFSTRLAEDDARQQNFETEADLESGGQRADDAAFVVNADARTETTIRLAVCLDPSPQGRELDVGTYTATVRFIDERIPETTFDFEVVVGDPNGAGFAGVAVLGAVVLLASLPVLVIVGALVTRRPWRDELRRSWLLLACLMVVALVGYLWAVLDFRSSDDYRLWQLDVDGIRDFGGHSYKLVAAGITGFVALLVLLPQVREKLGAAPAPATPPPARSPLPPPAAGPRPAHPPAPPPAPPPASDLPPPQRGGRRVLPWLAGAAVAFVLLVVLTMTTRLAGDDEAEPTAVDPTVPTTENPDITEPSIDPEEILASLRVGETSGAEAATALRGAGFVVFAYDVCSSSVGTPGLLRLVRTTEGQTPLVDIDGPTAAADDVAPPDSLDVLVADGRPCNG